jgi:hypothetical protein
MLTLMKGSTSLVNKFPLVVFVGHSSVDFIPLQNLIGLVIILMTS